MKKLLLFGIVFIMLISSVNAALTDADIISYYKFDQDYNDYTGLNNLTNNGVTLVSGKIGNASDFDGGTDYLENTTFVGDLTEDFTIDFWLNFDAHQAFDMAVKLGGGDDDRFAINADGVTGNKLCIFDDIAHAGGVTCGSTVLNTGTYYYVTLVFNATGDQIDLYINNNFEVNRSSIYNISQLVAQDLNLGASVITTSSYLDGKLDEVGFYNKLLTDSERAIRYNAGAGNTPPFLFTPTITSNLQAYYNTPNISVNLNTTPVQNTNMSYVLDGGGEISICTNSSFCNVNLTGLSDAVHNVTWISTDIYGQVNTTENFTIDTIKPSLNVSLPNEFKSYFGFNFSQYINVSDKNLDTCIVSISKNANTTCTEQNYNFTINGNVTINITATDLAGNINSSLNNLMLINPTQIFNFQFNGTPVTSFTFGGVSYTNFANISTYGDIISLGNNTLLFEKAGYISQNFTFELNTSSNYNITYNVTAAKIIVNIFDRLDGTPLTQLVTVNILSLGNQTTTNGSTVFQDFTFVAGTYHLEAISAGYYTEEKDFTYTGETNAIVNVYMLNATQNNSATLFVNVLDEFFNIIQDADTRLLEYDPSIFGFKEVSQCDTNSNGECQFLVEVGTKTYIITTSKLINGVLFEATSSTDGETFQPEISGGQEILGQEIVRQLFLELSSNLATPSSVGLRITAPDNVNDTIVSQNSTTTVINIPTSFIADNGLSYTVCLELYRVGGANFISVVSPICTTGSSGILPISNINLNNAFDYQARITITFDGQTTIYKTYSYPNNQSFIELLLAEGLVSQFILLFWVILLASSMYLRSLGIWVYGAWGLSVIQLVLFTNVLVASSSVLIILINIGVLYISKRQGDTI